jgi:hypothetical protein
MEQGLRGRLVEAYSEARMMGEPHHRAFSEALADVRAYGRVARSDAEAWVTAARSKFDTIADDQRKAAEAEARGSADRVGRPEPPRELEATSEQRADDMVVDVVMGPPEMVSCEDGVMTFRQEFTVRVLQG